MTGYCVDGSSTERKIEDLLDNTAPKHLLYTIKHPGASQGWTDLKLSIPCYGQNGKEHPVVLLQDSQHGKKTYRNNLHSGARLLTIGNEVVMYSHIRDVAFQDGPLYHHDVEKVDRQDDNAATRLFSADTLQWLMDHAEEDHIGVNAYLFVFGELIDAYQNRTMHHLERLILALRAYFFVEAWESFLEAAGYDKKKHFISHQACDITRRLMFGLVELVLVYRDYYCAHFPLLPWLMSTEPCEHIFGLCRLIVKDFTMLDFQQMVPKLAIQLREAALQARVNKGNTTASGYNHTYLDSGKASLPILRVFPSDDDIQRAASTAFEEAMSLFTLLGVAPANLSSKQVLGLCLDYPWNAIPLLLMLSMMIPTTTMQKVHQMRKCSMSFWQLPKTSLDLVRFMSRKR